MSKRLVICSRQKRYAACLAEHIANRRDLAVQLTVCTSIEKLNFLEEKQIVHILLIDAIIPYSRRRETRARKRFVLTEGRCLDLGEEEKAIYRYQSATQIIAEILAECADLGQGFFNYYQGKKEVLGIYSPVHRIGKSAFARMLGRSLSRKKEVLYLSLEEYSSFEWEGDEVTLADLLYYTKQEGQSLGIPINNAKIHMEGIDMIPPIPLCADLKEVRADEWKVLLERILDESQYHILIVDFSESVQGLFEILEICSIIFMPYIEGESEEKRIEDYKRGISKIGYSEILDKTIPILMQHDKTMCVQEALHQIGKEEARYAGRTALC